MVDLSDLFEGTVPQFHVIRASMEANLGSESFKQDKIRLVTENLQDLVRRMRRVSNEQKAAATWLSAMGV